MSHRAKHPPAISHYNTNKAFVFNKKALAFWVADCKEQFGKYRDGSEGKEKPFKPRHYPGIDYAKLMEAMKE